MVSSTNPLKLENSILVLGTSLGNSGDATASGLVPWPQKWRLMLTDSYRFYGYFMVFTYRSGGNTRLPCSFPLKKTWLGGFLTEFRPPKSLELRTDHRRRNRIPPKEEESAADGGSAPIKVWIQGKNMETWWNFNNFRLYHGLVYLTLFPIIKSRKGRDIQSL